MSEEKKGFFSRLVEGLTKTRNNIMSGFDAIFSGFSNMMKIFMKNWKKCLLWQIWVFIQRRILLRN